jgi:hypothetical protein
MKAANPPGGLQVAAIAGTLNIEVRTAAEISLASRMIAPREMEHGVAADLTERPSAA